MDLELKRERNGSVMVVRLSQPLYADQVTNLYVALCRMSYQHNANSYNNCATSRFDLSIPRFTQVKPDPLPPKPNPDPGTGGYATAKVEFVKCKIENSINNSFLCIVRLLRKFNFKHFSKCHPDTSQVR